MSAALVVSWGEGVTAAAAGGGEFVVQGPRGRVTLRQVAPALVDALRRFDPPGTEEGHLAELVPGSGDGLLAKWCYYLERLSQRGLLCQSARAGKTVLATLEAVSSGATPPPARAIPGRRYVLSRFAYLARPDGRSVLESPASRWRVVLHDSRAAALAGALTAPAASEELTEIAGGLGPEQVTSVLTLMLRAGILGAEGPGGGCVADDDTALQTWEFHDLLFHARSRTGRSVAPHGGTCRLAGRLAPPPAVKPAPRGVMRELDRPDLARLERDDPPLARVQEQRCSARDFDGERPITPAQLGEFLFRVARVKDCWQAEVATDQGPIRMDFASRPYPSGGALYELEIYAAVNRSAGFEPGLYHYDPSRHALTRLGGHTAELNALLRDAAESTAVPQASLQVLIVVAARFPRVAWKYESIAYALTLKHVGVLLQTMYLAATAMGLGARAVGCGDSDLFARAAGTNYYAETSVGEFLLGTRRPGAVPSAF